MMNELLENLIVKIRNKPHVLEILPTHNLYCCFLAKGKKYYFTLSRSNLEIVQEGITTVDITIEGTEAEIVDLLNGRERFTKHTTGYRGSFRHFLLMDSLFALLTGMEKKEVS